MTLQDVIGIDVLKTSLDFAIPRDSNVMRFNNTLNGHRETIEGRDY